MTASLVPIWVMDFISNLLIMGLSLYCVRMTSRISKIRPNVSLWVFLHWQVVALCVFAFSHAIGHILKRMLVLGGYREAWEIISPFTGGINSMTFVMVGVMTFLYKDMKMASEKYQELDEAKAALQVSADKLQESYGRLEEDAAVIAKQNAELWLTNKELDNTTGRLREANDTLKSFFEAIPDGVFIVDKDMVVKEQNSRLSYFAPHLKVGEPCYDNVDASHSTLCMGCVVKKSLMDGEVHEQEAAMDVAGGGIRHVHNICAPIKDDKGRVVLAVSVLRDITERFEMTERVIKQNEELKVLDKAKSNFIDIASHELRTPLSSILGYADLMAEAEKKGERDNYHTMIEAVQRSSFRLREIIDDLLDVARMESGKLMFKRETFRLQELLERLAGEFEPFYTQRGQKVIMRLDGSIPDIVADYNRLNQVFNNLVSNAIKYTPDGGVITVSAGLVDTHFKDPALDRALRSLGSERPETMLHVTVADTGIGIPRDDLDKIFDRFYEVGDVSQHSSGKSKFMGGGTGLGLSIAKGIVEGHGGRIWAESEGRDERLCPGAVFHVLLPVQGAQAEKPTPAPPPVVREREAPAAPAVEEAAVKPVVLLIEDDPDITRFTSRILERKYAVIGASDGMDGIKKAFEARPDVILLDIWMYGLDGYEVCRILKANPHTKDIPVAFFTASAQKVEIEKGYDAGADDYITKPFTTTELMDRVARLIGEKAGLSAGTEGA